MCRVFNVTNLVSLLICPFKLGQDLPSKGIAGYCIYKNEIKPWKADTTKTSTFWGHFVTLPMEREILLLPIFVGNSIELQFTNDIAV